MNGNNNIRVRLPFHNDYDFTSEHIKYIKYTYVALHKILAHRLTRLTGVKINFVA